MQFISSLQECYIWTTRGSGQTNKFVAAMNLLLYFKRHKICEHACTFYGESCHNTEVGDVVGQVTCMYHSVSDYLAQASNLVCHILNLQTLQMTLGVGESVTENTSGATPPRESIHSMRGGEPGLTASD